MVFALLASNILSEFLLALLVVLVMPALSSSLRFLFRRKSLIKAVNRQAITSPIITKNIIRGRAALPGLQVSLSVQK